MTRTREEREARTAFLDGLSPTEYAEVIAREAGDKAAALSLEFWREGDRHHFGIAHSLVGAMQNVHSTLRRFNRPGEFSDKYIFDRENQRLAQAGFYPTYNQGPRVKREG